MEHNGVLYHGGDLRHPFKHVTVEDLAQWCTLSPVDMLHVWHRKVSALGLVNLQERREKHDGPQDKHAVPMFPLLSSRSMMLK